MLSILSSKMNTVFKYNGSAYSELKCKKKNKKKKNFRWLLA